jgi:methylated-DNA-protein-cysteine methyltransferase-like protein
MQMPQICDLLLSVADRSAMGTPQPGGFDQRVYALVAHIPHGRVATYGQVAELIGAWGCARQVGWALKRLALPSDVPWHRVVNAQGRISLSLGREGSDWIQLNLLRAEGIPVDDRGHLPLAAYRWQAIDLQDSPPLPPEA